MRWSWIELDAGALQSNVRMMVERAAPSGLMAVVKANGYGHDDVWTAWHAVESGASWLGVASPAEASNLRRAGITAPILVFGATPPEDVRAMAEQDVSLTVLAADWVPILAEVAHDLPKPVRLHLKVDSGMGRVGVAIGECAAVAARIRKSRGLRLEGVYSHFAQAEEDMAFTELQLSRFRQALAHIGDLPEWIHVQNSAGILNVTVPEANLARSGIALYGLSPTGRDPAPEGLRPVLSLRSRAIQVKTIQAGEGVGYGRTWIAEAPTQIATLPVGYADGVSRLLSNAGEVLFQGQRWPIVGRVSMDLLTVALTENVRVHQGDVFTLIGGDGDETITADEVAARIGTIGYEVTASLLPRLPRLDADTRQVIESLV